MVRLKTSATRQLKIEQTLLMIFYDLYEKPRKLISREAKQIKKYMCNDFPSFLLKGTQQKLTTADVSPRGPKRGNSTMTTSTIRARRKGDPQHYVEGKMYSYIYLYMGPAGGHGYTAKWGYQKIT